MARPRVLPTCLTGKALTMRSWTRSRTRYIDESAASSIEYAILASLIALVIIASVTAIGISLDVVFTDVLNGF